MQASIKHDLKNGKYGQTIVPVIKSTLHAGASCSVSFESGSVGRGWYSITHKVIPTNMLVHYVVMYCRHPASIFRCRF